VHVATPDLLGRWTMSYARRKGIPVVTTYHTDFSAYLRYYRLECLESLLIGYLSYFYRRCDLVCVPSKSMSNELQSRGVGGDMRIWARGVDTDRYAPGWRSMQWRRRHGVTDDVPLITYVGRVVHEKNVHLIADLSDILTSRGVAHRMMLVGEGPARDDLESRLPNAIFTGHLDEDDLSRAYASSDIFFFPSVTETFGNVVLEAMSSQVPTVCAQATGSSDLVNHGSTGFLFQEQDLATMVDQVERLATDSRLREAMGELAREAALSYQWSIILDRMIGYYAETLRTGAPTSPAIAGLSRPNFMDRNGVGPVRRR
jgi:glycosyltransferase involved in cell wall biosynthesis